MKNARRLAVLRRHIVQAHACNASTTSPKCRVGFVGYGKVGQFLVEHILSDEEARASIELVFVCDPVAPDAVRNDAKLPDAAKLYDLDAFERVSAIRTSSTSPSP